jgi:hypothetical protein
VDAHDVGVIGHAGQPGAHARAARLAAGDTVFALGIRAGTTTITPSQTDSATRRERSITRSSPSRSYCLAAPNRWPEPPPTTTAHTVVGRVTPAQRSTVISAMSEHLERLARTPFFADASTPLLAMVSDASQTRTLVRGDVLFNEGDPPDALYLVTAGRIAIAMSNPIDRRESVVALMEPGDLFGELGLLDDGPRSAMARALERSELIEVPFGPCARCSTQTRGCCGTSPACSPGACGRWTRCSPTRSSSTSPAAPPSACSSWRTGPTSSSSRSRRRSWRHGRRVARAASTRRSPASSGSAGCRQQDRTYKIIQRDRLELRAR